uniref:Ig-like domain-containing protein n=1 Tax=Oryzias latipes TaxID=8090 RepID=A0A3B3HMT9_ORYLA
DAQTFLSLATSSCSSEGIRRRSRPVERLPPNFTKKPSESMTDSSGQTVKMEGRVSGSQPLTVTWCKDNREIKTSEKYDITFKNNMAVLLVKNSSVSDGGVYLCQVSNEAGKASCQVSLSHLFKKCDLKDSASVFLITVRTPSKQKSPKKEGDINIVDLLRGHDPKDYERILREHEIYDYRAILQAVEFLKREKEMEAGKFTKRIQNIEVNESHSATFECELSFDNLVEAGEVKLTAKDFQTQAQLLVRGKVHNDNPHSFPSTRLLIVVDAKGVFWCVHLEPPVEFTKPLEDQTVEEEAKATLECEVSRENEVKLSKRLVYRTDGLKHTLTIKDCVMEDEGEYTAVVGESKCSAELIISEAPTDFSTQLKDQTITEKRSTNLESALRMLQELVSHHAARHSSSATIKGVPTPTVSWTKNNEAVPAHVSVVVTASGSKVFIPKCVRPDSGNYTVTVENPAGKKSATVVVLVLSK